MGNVHMEASQVNYRGGETKMSVEEAIRTGMQPYELPTASASTLGGIKVGTNLSIDENGVLSASGSTYTLPPASSNTLGGIKVGNGLDIDANGKLFEHSSYVYTPAHIGIYQADSLLASYEVKRVVVELDTAVTVSDSGWTKTGISASGLNAAGFLSCFAIEADGSAHASSISIIDGELALISHIFEGLDVKTFWFEYIVSNE